MINLFNKIKQYSVLILGAIAAIFITLFTIEKNEKDADETLLGEQKTQNQVAQINTQIEQQNQEVKAEEQKQQEIQKNINQEQKENTSEDEMLKFLNDPNKQ